MRKSGTLHIILEIVTILSNIIIGVTILTFIAYQYQEGLELNKSFVGSIVLAIGVTEMVEFLSLKTLGKLRNIPNAIVAGLSMILGVLIMTIDMELSTTCIVWGICSIAFQVVKIANAGYNILKQPFLNTVIIILCVTEAIFSIFLIAKTVNALEHHLTFIGISLLVEAFILIVEFIIHRYQNKGL